MSLDLHHIPNIKDGRRLIKKFSIENGLTIALPASFHKAMSHSGYPEISNARDLLAQEIIYIRKVVYIPSHILLGIIKENLKLFPESFKKKQ